jgi:ornithine--oxo-acid transaminase
VKGVPADTATIVVCDGNFHGRTTTIVSFSDDPAARAGFGPFTPGFRRVPYGDAEALLAAIDASTVAVLVEPVQGEAGVIVPPDGYLRAVRSACDRHGLLMLADEIQSGLGRTGDLFGCDREGVVPDVYILGKALGGGLLPLSAVVSRRDVLGVFGPGDHGSTFGGNPLACAVGLAVLELLKEGTVLAQGRERATQLRTRLAGVSAPLVREVRLEGLWAGIELAADGPTAREVCHRMADHGVLAKDTHVTTVRLAPPLVITADELDEGLDVLVEAIEVLAGGGR